MRRFRPFGDKRLLICRVLNRPAPVQQDLLACRCRPVPLKWGKNFKLV